MEILCIKNADAAMYHAKSLGKNNYQFYKSSMNASALEKLTLENHLHNALAQDELMLYYQPQIDSQTGKITGMEALMRWNHPGLGLVAPSKFIPIAEDTGLILPIGTWLLNMACAQNKAWQDAGLSPGHIAINLSARQFNEYNLVQSVKDALSQSGLEARWLELEITENVIMQKTEVTIDILNELKAMGIQFAIDDFGTGYSSLAYLKKFPIDRIKIDRSFIQDMTSSPDSVAIVAAIIAMAKTLHLSVIAEGVETESQQAMIVEQGCPHIQGFLYSKPLPSDQATAFLKQYSTKTSK